MGSTYETPMATMRMDKDFVIPLTYNPDTGWCLNVKAVGSVCDRVAYESG